MNEMARVIDDANEGPNKWLSSLNENPIPISHHAFFCVPAEWDKFKGLGSLPIFGFSHDECKGREGRECAFEVKTSTSVGNPPVWGQRPRTGILSIYTRLENV